MGMSHGWVSASPADTDLNRTQHPICTEYAPNRHRIGTEYAPNMHPICTQYHPICTQYAPNMHPIRTQYAPNTHPIRMDLDHSAEHGRADQKERKRRLYHFFLDRVIGRCTLVSFSGPESLRRTNIVCGTRSTKHAKEYQACKGPRLADGENRSK